MTDPTPAPRRTPETAAEPPVTAIVVVRDDDAVTVAAAIDDLLNQQYRGDLSIVIAVARGGGAAGALAAELAGEHPRVSTLEFASSSLIVGVNEAIAASRTSIVIRVDPRCSLPADFVATAVAAMARTDAAALVAKVSLRGGTPFEQAVARALTAPAGLGSDPLTAVTTESQVQSAYAHVIRRRAFIDVGLYNEEIRHGQGWELNERLRESGQTIWFVPELVLDVTPPSRVVELTRSLFAEGLWRGEFARAFPQEKVLRFFYPPVIVVATLVGFILGAVGFFGAVAGALGVAAVISLVLFAFLVVPVGYAVGVIVLGISAMAKITPRTGLWYALVLPLVHFSWGFGFIAGFVNLEGAADTVIVDFD